MKSLKLKTILILSAVIFLSGSLVFGFVGESLAGTSQNVSGWAWSSNIGWISFNNTTGGGGYDYGVNLDDSGNFSGYAWSSNIGWVSFNRSDTGNPSSNDPGSGSGAIAKYNSDTDKILGWARALSQGGGWDGWIALGDMNTNDAFNYGASINSSNSDFEGWAWGSDVVGWISFNCANRGTCGDSNYKTATTSSVPGQGPNIPSNFSVSLDNCKYQATSAPVVKWKYTHPQPNRLQAEYQVKIGSDSNFSNVIYFNQSAILHDQETATYTLIGSGWNEWVQWGKRHWISARVKDERGKWSQWTPSLSFDIPKHAYPWVNFGSLPTVIKDIPVTFSPQYQIYAPFKPLKEGEEAFRWTGLNQALFNWKIVQGPGTPTITYPDETSAEKGIISKPRIKITWWAIGDYSIEATLIDYDNYSCNKRANGQVTTQGAPPPPSPPGGSLPPTSPIKDRYKFGE